MGPGATDPELSTAASDLHPRGQ
ncbi:hypothetical protein E2C01_080056 [Portunus trituberculatus]|uniref:Uncharacterized protein n=1 Tax=Portunus trituberculatus TaxID=210409 RepID=A0A5B7IXD8_PORTR|nr:hypothetical protein [Portunus trituberculatus]